MYVSQEVYERYSDRWDELKERGGGRVPHTCETCAHEGCCDHSCGGSYWQVDNGEEEGCAE